MVAPDDDILADGIDGALPMRIAVDRFFEDSYVSFLSAEMVTPEVFRGFSQEPLQPQDALQRNGMDEAPLPDGHAGTRTGTTGGEPDREDHPLRGAQLLGATLLEDPVRSVGIEVQCLPG